MPGGRRAVKSNGTVRLAHVTHKLLPPSDEHPQSSWRCGFCFETNPRTARRCHGCATSVEPVSLSGAGLPRAVASDHNCDVGAGVAMDPASVRNLSYAARVEWRVAQASARAGDALPGAGQAAPGRSLLEVELDEIVRGATIEAVTDGFRPGAQPDEDFFDSVTAEAHDEELHARLDELGGGDSGGKLDRIGFEDGKEDEEDEEVPKGDQADVQPGRFSAGVRSHAAEYPRDPAARARLARAAHRPEAQLILQAERGAYLRALRVRAHKRAWRCMGSAQRERWRRWRDHQQREGAADVLIADAVGGQWLAGGARRAEPIDLILAAEGRGGGEGGPGGEAGDTAIMQALLTERVVAHGVTSGGLRGPLAGGGDVEELNQLLEDAGVEVVPPRETVRREMADSAGAEVRGRTSDDQHLSILLDSAATLLQAAVVGCPRDEAILRSLGHVGKVPASRLAATSSLGAAQAAGDEAAEAEFALRSVQREFRELASLRGGARGFGGSPPPSNAAATGSGGRDPRDLLRERALTRDSEVRRARQGAWAESAPGAVGGAVARSPAPGGGTVFRDHMPLVMRPLASGNRLLSTNSGVAGSPAKPASVASPSRMQPLLATSSKPAVRPSPDAGGEAASSWVAIELENRTGKYSVGGGGAGW